MAEPLVLDLSVDVPPEWEGQIDLRLLTAAAEAVLRGEGWTGRVEVELLVVDDEEMRELNARHRGVDAATDVLAFPLLSTDDAAMGFVGSPDGVRHLGDVVISLPRALEQARDYGHSPERELAYLFVHGVLHLLGHDHEEDAARERMRSKEEAALSAVGLER